MTRSWAALAAAASLGSILVTGCTQKAGEGDVLLKIIARTERVARQYEYSELALGHRTVVTGTIADDLDYTAHVTVDGSDAMDEVVKDDSRALRITSADLLEKGLRSQPTTVPGRQPSASPTPGQSPSPLPASGLSTAGSTALGGTAVPLQSGASFLQAGQWVQDPTGASSLRETGNLKIQEGNDPVLDGLTVLDYVAQVVNQSAGVVQFNPESPDYKAYEDPFPPPDKAAGEIRYDLNPVPLASHDAIGASPVQRIQALPQANYFRHLGVYVRNGYVVAVRESISAVWRLKDSTQDILPRLADLGFHIPADLPLTAKAQAVIAALNALETKAQEPVIRAREVVFTLSHLRAAGTVELPPGAVTASLNGIYERGQVLNQDATLATEGI